MITIPLLNGAANAHQRFTIQLGDNLLEFTLNYVTTYGPAWSVDIAREGVTLVSGAMLEPNAVITDGYEAGIGRLVFVGEDVTLDNLGLDNSLLWVADDEQL
ncbi:MAG: phage baseplate plug family protein [Shewanella sp.]